MAFAKFSHILIFIELNSSSKISTPIPPKSHSSNITEEKTLKTSPSLVVDKVEKLCFFPSFIKLCHALQQQEA